MIITFTARELGRLIQVGRLGKLNVDAFEQTEISVEVESGQAQELMQAVKSAPMGGNMEQLESVLPVYRAIVDKLSEAVEVQA